MRSRTPIVGMLAIVLLLNTLLVATVSAHDPANHPFHLRWSHTDGPVAAGQTSRTWMWGPEAFTPGLTEEYDGLQREVQYFDKTRMEINNPDADPANLWYVTNGLLVVELISGQMQIGDDAYIKRHPSGMPVAGDADSTGTPSYAALASLLDDPAASTGTVITSTVASDGTLGVAPALATHNVTAAHHVEATGHTVASPFWAFMNSTGLVSDGAMAYEGRLFPDPFYATGYPITEAHWTKAKVGGTEKDVLVQAFERRVLTYTPDNPEGWQVEAGNVGRHYHAWRYDDTAGGDHDVMFSIPVGPEGLEYRFGSNPPVDVVNYGPNAISVAPDGTFWVGDAAGIRLVHFSTSGELLNEIDLTPFAASTVLDVEASNGDIWALFANFQLGLFKLGHFIPEGQMIEIYDLHEDQAAWDLAGYSPGILVTDNDEVVLQGMGGVRLLRVVDTAGAQESTELDGVTYSGRTYSWRYDAMTQHVLLVDDVEVVFEGRSTDFALETGLVDQVAGDSFYARVVYVPASTYKSFRYTVEHVAVDGTRLGIAHLPTAENFVYVQFDLAAGPNGEVYQLVTHKHRIDVLRLNVEPS